MEYLYILDFEYPTKTTRTVCSQFDLHVQSSLRRSSPLGGSEVFEKHTLEEDLKTPPLPFPLLLPGHHEVNKSHHTFPPPCFCLTSGLKQQGQPAMEKPLKSWTRINLPSQADHFSCCCNEGKLANTNSQVDELQTKVLSLPFLSKRSGAIAPKASTLSSHQHRSIWGFSCINEPHMLLNDSQCVKSQG